MRISRLDLLRYGKFTDCNIPLPHSSLDFHLIIGPNEAGKSTVRSAILDLLFGIEARSIYNFLHPNTEMRLGSLIEHGNKSLDFQRTKARKQSLLTPAGTVLAENSIIEFLGTTDRAFFDQMFGLDHDKLVAGGNEILKASNDIGQILFQSAAGIEGLGVVRAALDEEANKLWARKKSGDREYYVARDELEKAQATLKQATVRTKNWTDARSKVVQVEEQRDKSKNIYKDLERDRIRLERIRRVAPALNTIREANVDLKALGDVTKLSPGAGRQLTDTELELATANQTYTLLENQTNTTQNQLYKLHLNDLLLTRETDIQALSNLRQQVRNHESDIIKRLQEIKVHRQNLESYVRQLGWPTESEEALERRLPALPVRTVMASLLKRHPIMEREFTASKQALCDKITDLKSLDEQVEDLPSRNVSPSLRSALISSRNLGDVNARMNVLEAQVAKASRELDSARTGLGRWNLTVEALRNLTLPSVSEIDELQKRQATHEASANALSERLAGLHFSIRNEQLEVDQYRAAHHPVTMAELNEARVERDTVWLSIKSGSVHLAEVATDYESRVWTADDVSDKRHEKAQEVAELQSKLDSLQRLKQQTAELEERIATIRTEEIALQNGWSARANEIGLLGMPLLSIREWCDTRERVLRGADAVADAKSALDDFARTVHDAKTGLLDALDDASSNMGQATLAALIVAASDVVDGAMTSKARHEELKKQVFTALAAKTALEDRATNAEAAMISWTDSWNENLVLAGLHVKTDVGTAEGALILFDSIEKKLETIQELRKARIEMMQNDLSDFKREATALMSDVAPDLTEQSPTVVAKELTDRLEKARADKKEFDRLSLELSSSKTRSANARDQIVIANAKIQPLFDLAKASTNDELREAIARSDRWRSLCDTVTAAKKTVQEGGDGLSLEELELELQSADVSQIPIGLAEIEQRRNEALSQQNDLSADLANANMALSKIAGQDAAACAESQRQDALAKMANAAERYIKVFTASRLLRWAIDRYRETKQGPMLVRAGEIFSALTLGSFKKLSVDFDKEPLALDSQRDDGRIVGVAGMSDGTRDQLYLALRLAAMELHLEQTQSLPFVADDLFINFDNARSKAGLEALAQLSKKTQVIFLTHHDHLENAVRSVFGQDVNVIRLS